MSKVDLSRNAFAAAWRGLGQPMIDIIMPVSEWNLPPGINYDPLLDAWIDSEGDVVSDLSPYWLEDSVSIVPDTGDNELLALLAAGIVNAGSTVIYVYGEGDIERVRTAWRISLKGEQYVLYSITPMPTVNPRFASAVLNRI